MIDDNTQYGSTLPAEAGESHAIIQEDGSITFEWVADKDKAPKFSKWKGGKAIMESSDDKVKLLGHFNTGSYYNVVGATVKYRGRGNGKRRQYICLKPGCGGNICPHSKRLDRYRTEHPSQND